jgi:hypothetical protein
MPKIEGVIKSEILRLAKRHVKMVFLPLKREVRQMNRRLSGLSRTVAFLGQANAPGGSRAQAGGYS